MAMNNEIVALYELKRQAFLLGYIQFPDKFNDALAFAYLLVGLVFMGIVQTNPVRVNDSLKNLLT